MSGRKYYVYTHSTLERGIFYIGKGDEKRITRVTRASNPHHARIVKKYGKENIVIKTMLCRSEQHALDLEVRMIAALRQCGVKLANITDGGEGFSGMVHSSETRLKMRVASANQSSESRENKAAANRNKIYTPELRAKMSEAGKNRPPMSDETRAKMTISNRNRSPESLAKLSKSLKNQSAESRAKRSASCIGRKMSAEAIEKRQASRMANNLIKKLAKQQGIQLDLPS